MSLPCFGLQLPLKGNGSLSPVTASHLTSLGFRFPRVRRICFHVLGLNKQAIKCSSRLTHGKSFGKCYYGFCPWYVCLDVQCSVRQLCSSALSFISLTHRYLPTHWTAAPSILSVNIQWVFTACRLLTCELGGSSARDLHIGPCLLVSPPLSLQPLLR